MSLYDRLILLALRAYKLTLSPLIGRQCRYLPTCSEYAVQAVGRFGILRGVVLAGWRLLRCNPWSHGGYDPVDAQRLFAAQPAPRHSPASHS